MRKISILVSTLTLVLTTAGFAFAQRVTVTMAGTGTYGLSNDGLAGYISQVSAPHDVCMDAAHNLYYVDNGNGLVRKISATDGTVTTIAGGGSSTADGVPATSESIAPVYMCIDAAQNIYIACSYQVKKITAATGIITTVAGNGASGYTGDGGAATAATFNSLGGICIDAAGNLYLIDEGNNCIRKVTAATGIVSTIAGSTTLGYTGDGGLAASATLDNPLVICVTAAGDLFFSDQNGSFIREIKAATGIISTIAGTGSSADGDGGPAIDAGIGEIMGICADDSGNIYINDISCSCRKIDMTTGLINVVAGSLTSDGYNGDGLNSVDNWLNFPYGLCVDGAGNIYIADGGNNRIRKEIMLSHSPSFIYGAGVYVYACPGAVADITNQMSVTDLDAGQSETWTVVSAPLHGSLSGFPFTGISLGAAGMLTPSALSYAPGSGFTGQDSFKVKIDDGGFSNIVTVYVSVPSSAPSAGIITGGDSVCENSSIALFDTVADGSWNVTNTNIELDGGGTLIGMSPGMDTVTFTVTNGCTVSTSVVVTVLPPIDAGIITGSADTVSAAAPLALSETVTGGTWSSTDTTVATVSPTGVVTAVSPGYVDIEYTVASELYCSSTAYYYVTVDSAALFTSSVKNINAASLSMLVAPNPAKGHFTINVSSSADEQVIITISNIAGEKLREITGITNSTISADLDAPAGIYLINASSAHGSRNGKLVIQ